MDKTQINTAPCKPLKYFEMQKRPSTESLRAPCPEPFLKLNLDSLGSRVWWEEVTRPSMDPSNSIQHQHQPEIHFQKRLNHVNQKWEETLRGDPNQK